MAGLIPQENDVLSGSGRKAMNHPGNVYFRDLVKGYSKENDSRGRIGESIIDAIAMRGGRFLKSHAGTNGEQYWYELSRNEAIEKTSQAIRDAAKKAPTTPPRPEAISSDNNHDIVVYPRFDDPMLITNSIQSWGATQSNTSDVMVQNMPTTNVSIDIFRVPTEPTVVDVLCGSGGRVMKHTGNQIYRSLVKGYIINPPLISHGRVGESLVDIITDYGGRFLKSVEGDEGSQYWCELSREEAIDKAARAIRDAAAKAGLSHHGVVANTANTMQAIPEGVNQQSTQLHNAVDDLKMSFGAMSVSERYPHSFTGENAEDAMSFRFSSLEPGEGCDLLSLLDPASAESTAKMSPPLWTNMTK